MASMDARHDPVERLRLAMNASELVRAQSQRTKSYRALNDNERQQLLDQGNSAQDWSLVQVANRFDANRIRHSTFQGKVFLGQFSKPVAIQVGVELPSGIERSTVIDCEIDDNALIRNVGMIANYRVCEGALISDCQSIVCDQATSFGNGTIIPIGPETGDRELPIVEGLDIELARQIVESAPSDSLRQAYEKLVAEFLDRIETDRGYIGTSARIMNSCEIKNTFIGSHAQINGVTRVLESTLNSCLEDPVEVTSGACLSQAIVHEGSHISTMAIVERSLLTEHSGVESHGKLKSSILGPNSHVANGEVTSCLLGPFVGFHHQALLIAALWPEGRGNVAYGANVGSNHTSKAPDQEIWIGEGTFFGLGVNVKFPTDLSDAPYTIIASGINTLPQKITFPFSLINSPSIQAPALSPAFNEIVPAWQLTENVYAIRRNELKFKTRNKARRADFDDRVFRPHIIDMMRSSKRRLAEITNIKPIYTERDIAGLGKNFLVEANRLRAIESYEFYTRYYALLGLKQQVQKLAADAQTDQLDQLLTDDSEDDSYWAHQRQILRDEDIDDVLSALEMLLNMSIKIAQATEQSKAKDDHRGKKIVPDYEVVHTCAKDDPFVQQTWRETKLLIAETETLLTHFQRTPPPIPILPPTNRDAPQTSHLN